MIEIIDITFELCLFTFNESATFIVIISNTNPTIPTISVLLELVTTTKTHKSVNIIKITENLVRSFFI